MAATHVSVARKVLRSLDALPDGAGPSRIERAFAPLRRLVRLLISRRKGLYRGFIEGRTPTGLVYQQIVERHKAKVDAWYEWRSQKWRAERRVREQEHVRELGRLGLRRKAEVRREAAK